MLSSLDTCITCLRIASFTERWDRTVFLLDLATATNLAVT